MKNVVLVCCLLLAGQSWAGEAVEIAKSKTYEAINVHPLLDGMSHWRKRYGRDRDDAMFDPTQIVHIAENMLVYQNADGGWPNNVDWQADVNPDTVRTIKGERRMISTFDNHNTFTQIGWTLCMCWQAKSPPKCNSDQDIHRVFPDHVLPLGY